MYQKTLLCKYTPIFHINKLNFTHNKFCYEVISFYFCTQQFKSNTMENQKDNKKITKTPNTTAEDTTITPPEKKEDPKEVMPEKTLAPTPKRPIQGPLLGYTVSLDGALQIGEAIEELIGPKRFTKQALIQVINEYLVPAYGK